MAKRRKPDEGLIETGKPSDPAKKENPDTREDQLQAEDQRTPQAGDNDPALETTRQAGQGTG
jgi:hypothetical protein